MPKNMSGENIHDGISMLIEYDSGIQITVGRDTINVWPSEEDGYLDLKKSDESQMESMGWVYRRDESEGGSWVYQAK